MKRKLFARLAIVAAASFVFYGCKKHSGTDPDSSSTPALHTYGVNPMTPDQWSFVPVFSKDKVGAKGTGLSATGLPSSYLLASPAVRDQGQIGSCTGFCGAETDEILHYYSSGGTVTSTSLTASNGASTAISTQFSGSIFGSSNALSPLFVYYVERCVINGDAITTDRGAYMVNIPEAFQGLSNNSGTGTALTKSISGTTYTFSGDCAESDYAYPSTGSTSSTQYTTPPSSTAIANAPAFNIGIQSGTTGSSGTTTTGYYVINSSNVVADAKVAIYNKKPVMMGFNVYDNHKYQYFENLGVTNYVYNPITSAGKVVAGLQILGGHAVPLIGYIDDASAPGGGYFIAENSWGTSWGYHGYFYVPYSVLANTKVVPAGSLYVAII